MTRKQTLEERFWRRVEKTDDCWIWRGGMSSKGYGLLGIGVQGERVNAHRYAYELLVGPIPPGLEIDHLCRVRHCVNPAHLEPVTGRENTRRGEAGRWHAIERSLTTHCPNRHPFDDANTYRRPDGARGCRECMREATRQWRKRQKNNTNQKAASA